MRLLEKETHYEKARFYVETYLEELRKLKIISVKAPEQIEQEKIDEEDEIYSPITQNKINNADKGETSSPLGDLMMHRKKKIDQSKKNQKHMEGISMKPIDEKVSP
jgi:hypothetical protein